MRSIDWPELLAQFFASRRQTPFAWGTNDCVVFAADAWVAMGLDDPIASLRGQWNSEQSAKQFCDSRGGLMAATVGELGAPIPGGIAQRGDIVLIDGGLCVCDGVLSHGPGALGTVEKQTAAALAAWHR